MKIGTVTTGVGVVTTLSINYLPQYLYFVAGTQFTSIKVRVEGDGTIIDLDADGLNAISGVRRYGAVADSYLIPLADGLIPKKVTEIVITNSAAQTPDIFGFSLQKGQAYIKTFQSVVLPNSPVDVDDFAYLGVKAATDNDEFQVLFRDNHQQRFQRQELLGWVTLYSNEVDSFVVDNVEGNIKVVNIVPDTQRTIYIMRFFPVGDLI